MSSSPLLSISYIISAVLFIFGLKFMSHPRTAVKGNMFGAAGMLVAVVVTLTQVDGIAAILVGALIGGIIGAVIAVRIEMTAMPQLVALFNGFGGLASVFVAGGDFLHSTTLATDPATDQLIATGASGLIGAVTFWGSLVAFAKLQELSWIDNVLVVPSPQAVNACLAGAVVLFMIVFVFVPNAFVYIIVVLIASVLGVLLVRPIGGADMPVVIALLNSYSGIAASATGFVINNNVLIISGSLVGASGIILTNLMCKAMNRSLINVLFGKIEAGGAAADADEIYATVRSTTADDVAMILDTAQRVVIVPGYGLAVAQAQHAVRDLGKLLEGNGTTVEYAIHPVAGRMPGHMNVLLAEADIEYDKLKEMDEINPTLETVDVAIIIGANDVVNPVARTDPDSPIAGMPIINVDQARTVVVIKRSLSPGFAKIPNPLFAAENTLMLFGDGQKAVLDIVTAINEG